MKKRKALVLNGIEVELLQALGKSGIKAIRQLCSVIWQSLKGCTEWRESVFDFVA